MTTQDTAPVPTQGDPGPPPVEPAAAATGGGGRRRRGFVVVAALLVVAAGGAGGAYALRDSSGTTAGPAGATRPVAVAPAAAAPVAAWVGLQPDGYLPYTSPLVLSVTSGTLLGVTGTGPDGAPVAGTTGADGRWTASAPLLPTATYAMTAQVRDAAGSVRSLPLPVSTTNADKTFTATLAPGSGSLVGVGQAVSLRLGSPVKDPTERAAIERSLTVTTVPAVQGAWRWMSSSELRYRGPDFWAAGTTITVTADLVHAKSDSGVWGPARRTTTFTVGDALTSVVDVKAHTMTVSKNGQVLRVLKASMGKPGFDTRNGTFVVLEKDANRVMDSATVDLPPGTPPYKTAVKDAVRLTNSGTFTHGAPWSVSSQGRANVSHGCINLSPADAHWYFLQAERGDVVTVVNSTVGPQLSDAGSQDWNMTFEQWKAGSALA